MSDAGQYVTPASINANESVDEVVAFELIIVEELEHQPRILS